MQWRKRLLCLLLVLAVCSGISALADAAVEDFWNYAYAADRSVYINTSDGLGLYMRYGPGTEYGKVNSSTIPNGTSIRITQECTASNGWKWGYCSYTFPEADYTDQGWICLVETTTQAPSASAPQQTQPAPEPAPAETAEDPDTVTEEPVPDTEAAETVTDSQTVQAEAQQDGQTVQGPAVYNSMLLVIIGILLGVIAAAAVLLLVTRRKR